MGKDRLTHILDIGNRVRSLCALREDAPTELIDLAVRLTSLEPEERPRTAREALEALEKASAKVPPSIRLTDFLRNVFTTYIETSLTPEIPSSDGLDSPPAASASESDFRFDKTAWDPRQPSGDEAEQAPEAEPSIESLYEAGWPKQFLPEATQVSAPPPISLDPDEDGNKALELIPNSSSEIGRAHV
mgnify:CR=1 FL=1